MLIWRFFFFCLLIFLPPYLEILGPSLLTIVLWVSWTFISLSGYKDQQYKEEAYQFLPNSMLKNKNAKQTRMYEGQTIYKYTCTNSKRVPQRTGKLFRICGTQKFYHMSMPHCGSTNHCGDACALLLGRVCTCIWSSNLGCYGGRLYLGYMTGIWVNFKEIDRPKMYWPFVMN